MLNRQIRSRCQRLMSMRRESNERLADFAVADVSLFWLLNALNSHANVLMNYESYPQRHPEIIWAELTRLAGSLLTFSLEHDLATIPAYVHDDLENTFPPLFDLLSTNTYVTLRLRREINASDIDRDYYIDAQAICEDWLENINVKYIEVSNDKAKLKLILGEKNCSSLYFITLSKDLNGWKIDSVESF